MTIKAAGVKTPCRLFFVSSPVGLQACLQREFTVTFSMFSIVKT